VRYVINVSRDSEAGVWRAANDTIPVELESDSFGKLIELVKATAYEKLSLDMMPAETLDLLFSTSAVSTSHTAEYEETVKRIVNTSCSFIVKS